MRGFWGMPCWNGLSEEQQQQLLDVGTLEIGYRAEGWCKNGANLCIETEDDKAPGPRFLCWVCAIMYVNNKYHTRKDTFSGRIEQGRN